MGPTTITAARIYKYREEGLLNFERLERTARIKTYSADAMVTDSAPSMGAYMTGVKINNDVISLKDARPVAPGKDANGNPTVDRCGDNNGSAPMTMLELAKASRRAVGAITTTELTHATPASTFSHVCNRNTVYTIAQQIVPGGAGYNPRLKDGVDVLMGGGRPHFTPFDAGANPKGRADGRDLLAELKARGYFVAATRADMMSALPNRKFVGIYADSHLDYATRAQAHPADPGRDDGQVDRAAVEEPEGLLPDGRRRQDRPCAARFECEERAGGGGRLRQRDAGGAGAHAPASTRAWSTR
jgi:alkaline phosphatase